MNRRRFVTGLLMGGCAVLIVSRFVWELLDPLSFLTVKSAIYWRDVATLGPATALGLIAVFRSAPRGRLPVDLARRVMLACATFVAVACALVSYLVLRGTPAVVDEAAYLWQAELLTHGRLAGAAGDASTLVQYVADVGGQRVSAFFPGSSVPLAVGHWVGLDPLVNPLLTGAWVAVVFWSARRLFDTRVAVLAVLFAAVSPFVFFQGASFFGQVWTALLTVPAVTLALSHRRRWDPALAGVLLGAACFSRPVSAVVAAGVAVVFWFVTCARREALMRSAMAAMAGAPLMLLFVAMNHQLTGEWLTTAHRLLLPDEQPVFGFNVVRNIALNAAGMAVDATGLVLVVLGLAALGVWRARRQPVVLALGAYAVAQAVAYSFYYNHGISYGPRYLFEVLAMVLMLAALGTVSIPALDVRAPALVALAAAVALVGVVPARALLFYDRANYLDLQPVVAQVGPDPALVLVAPGPQPYPDPFYPAFVSNGPDPVGATVRFQRLGPDNPCLVAERESSRRVFVLYPDRRLPARNGQDQRPFLVDLGSGGRCSPPPGL